MPSTASPSDHPARASRVAFVAIVLAMLPAVLDQTILATALPTIATDLGRLADVSWVVTAYVVSAATATPLWGKLGDRHGRKRLLEASLATFLAASALCGIAQSLLMLIVSRAVQGAAAGGLMTLAYAVVGDLVSPRERGRYQGYIMATFATAAAIGPLIGGLLVDHASWRWVFYVNLPVGLIALAGLRLRLPAPATQPPKTALDSVGAALLATATMALMLICIWGGQRYGWGSPEIIGLLAALAISAIALVARTRRAEDPIVPLALLRSPVVALSSLALFLVTATMFSITVFVPLFLQTTTGATPTQAGLLLIPMLVGITLSTNFAGRRIERTGRYKLFPLTGLVMISVSMVALAVAAAAPLQGQHRARPGAVRARVRDGRPSPDHRRPKRGRPPPARSRDGGHQLLSRPRGSGRRRDPRRDLRCPRRECGQREHRRRASRASRCDRRRAHRVPRDRADRARRAGRGHRYQGGPTPRRGHPATGRSCKRGHRQPTRAGRRDTISNSRAHQLVCIHASLTFETEWLE